MENVRSYWGIGIGGVGAAASIIHYMYYKSKLRGDVPIHFNFRGVPDNWASPKHFYIYPLITVSIAATTAIMDMYLDDVTGPAILPVMACSLAVLIISQHYGAVISMGETDRIPTVPFALSLASILVSSIASIVVITVHSVKASK